ncbi:MAG TPA: uroporphyrinogen-III C-methyltransferase [Candidatus Hydrogenedentes bacterium]|nr:uroporphyrinogen-III C-methyltransferase [Candidatus Hydrogenedentota bacterium]HPG67463.1 uroporphyrinogen-III C-methyltransferase [Candidatus Hydrogenedentota bacterium]
MEHLDHSRPTGKVWLVGAGPGDPGLITVKGRQCIADADVVVYDYLANPALLVHARADAERIYVGKIAGHHTMKQDDINRLLCAKAEEGKRVCRLKGGDPFVFGRGGEEALCCRERGVPFEVVPGVTSAIAVPAYAGIPVTHRSMTSSLRIITGHEDPTKDESRLDWREIAASSGTLVFLMGIRNVGRIADALIAGGRDPHTPAAVITNGTLPIQRSVVGTLETIAATVEQAGLEPPGLIVVGEVVGLRDALDWFERAPLFGRTIAVTRARAQASDLVATLEALGAEVISAPTIRIESLANSEPMRSAVRDIAAVDWIVFTSVNGVDAFFESLAIEGRDVRALAGTRIAAIGPATADRIRERGLIPDLVPETFVAEALLGALDKADQPFATQTYLLPRADIARIDLADGLRARGAEVVEVAAYRTLSEGTLPDGLLERLESDAVDLVTFTSSSTVRNFVDAIPAERRAGALAHVRAASIGPITSQTLDAAGIGIEVTATESTIPGLTAAIVDYFAKDTHDRY